MSAMLKRIAPMIVLSILAILMIIQYFFVIPQAGAALTEAQSWAAIISAFALTLGAVSTFFFNLRSVTKRVPGQWFFGILFIVLFSAWIVIGLVLTPSHEVYQYLANTIVFGLAAPVNSYFAFFVTSAAYRAFRARSWEAAVLLVSAVIIMLRNVPIGPAIWGGITPLGDWVYSVPQMAGVRGISIAMAIGLISLGLRTILGMERGAIRG